MKEKAKVITYGCQMNVNDSGKIRKILEDMNYEITEDIKKASIIVLNTCTIRKSAENRVYGKLGEAKAVKDKNEDAIIIIAGCLAQEDPKRIIRKAHYVDIIMGNQNIHKLPENIEVIKSKQHKKRIVSVENENELPPNLSADFESDITADVSITYGCNNFCTYCIVPYVRGRERSVPKKDIIKSVKNYLDSGYKEIMLLGQNVNSYGKDLKNTNFADLLESIAKIKEKFRIRFISPHPRDFTDDVLKVMAKEEKVCNYVHLPLQSGSTNILKKMNRGYTKEEYLKLVDKLKNTNPGITITTDIIVGFPGETVEDFNDTLDVVKKVEYDNAYMFMYSKREGTPAAKMEEQVDKKEKERRLQKLLKIQKDITNKQSESFLNKTVEILVEGETRKNPDNFFGRTQGNKIVIIKKDEKLKGKFVKVKITKWNTWTLYGDIIEGSEK
ncbi:MAG: tRNA (N6-isopentenyl adenosine(37)-C2)-methylthiotransferase MiaB [Fusobacteriota bacterium]